MYRWLNDISQQFLEKGYLLPGKTVDERVDVICNRAEEILQKPGFAAKLKENFQKGRYSFSTPIWINFGNNRGLPISCFGSNVDDSMESIMDTLSEIAIMTKYGGGTSAYFGNVRPRGSDITDNGKSSGSVHFMQMYNTAINVVSQGSARRGSLAPYLSIDHGDIEEFLQIKTEGNPIQDLQFGVTISDEWMNSMIEGDKKKRKIWAKVLERRQNVGFPYLFFSDNANNNTVDVYKDLGLKINNTNLCTEIMLPNSFSESFVCDLSSLNIRYYNEWKDTDAVETIIYLLDAVMTEFIEKASKIKHLERAVTFARRHRALGLGWFGWHSYLQSNMIPFESMEAKHHNVTIAKNIYDRAYAASAKLAQEYGEPELLKGYGRRNTTLLAIAPTKSSAWIIGQSSESIQPFDANIVIKDLAKGKFTFKNPYLEELLTQKGKNNKTTWNSILANGGSVQHLEFLSDFEKSVFKTFQEISPMETIIQAAQRQKYIDQGQSLNLTIHPSVPTKDVNALIIEAWKMGIKSLYYQFSVNAAQEFSRSILSCTNCES